MTPMMSAPTIGTRTTNRPVGQIHGVRESEERARQGAALGRGQLLDGLDQAVLRRVGRAPDQAPALGRHPQLEAARVGG